MLKTLGPKAIHRWLTMGEVIGPNSSIGPSTRRGPFYPQEWFVDGQNGGDGADGLRPDAPIQTIAEVLTRIRSGDVVYLTGNFTEEVGNTPKNVEDVTFLGVANKPRHADAARDAKVNLFGEGIHNSGASWRPPAVEGGTTPLITVVHQGWRFENILFDAPTDAACIAMDHSAVSGADDGGGGHMAIVGCRFASGLGGVEDTDGQGYLLIKECLFDNLTHAIRNTSTAHAIPLQWLIEDNWFVGNTNHIVMAASKFLIRRNIFGLFTTASLDLANGAGTAGESNMVGPGNMFYGDYDSAEGYVAATNDVWAGNYAITENGAAAGQGAININPST